MPNWTKEQMDAITLSGKNIIVSAGAGSGKTAVLTERVIQKLKKGISIKNLLILTFTNAAAAEMKDRIRAAITKDELIKDELDYIDSAYITTFDSYSLSVVKKYHYLINVTDRPKIVDSALISIEKKRILDSVMDEMYEEKHPEFLKMIKELCTKSDDEIKAYVMNINNKLDLLSEKETFLNNYIKVYFDDYKIDQDINEYTKFLKSKLNDIKDMINELSLYALGEYIEKIEMSLENLFQSDSYEEIKLNLNISLPRLPSKSDDEVKARKEEISKALKDLSKLCPYENTKEIKETVLLSKDYVIAFIEILKRLHKRIQEYKFKNDIFEFNDIAILAIKIVKEFPFIREEITESFNEILVDEYQDTNDLQEEFINLISDNNVYMVGDIKQSIYRFRNANPYIFKNKYDTYSDSSSGIKIDLKKNFRSRDEVLHNINEMFDVMMSDFLGGAKYKEEHQMIFGNTNYTTHKAEHDDNMEIYEYSIDKDSVYDKSEVEAFIISNDIKDKIKNKYQILDKKTNELRDCRYSDFTILMDRVATFELYKKIFEYNHIPLCLYKTEKITNEQDIIVIKNILLLAVKIKHQEYDAEFKHLYMSIARSFLYNMNDSDIFEIVSKNDFKNSTLYNDVLHISNKLDNLSCKKVLETIIDYFDIYNKLITLGNIESSIIRINTLLDIASNLTESEYTPYLFGKYLTDVIENDEKIEFTNPVDATDSVQIMNIHRSKGLEFSVCYYSGLYKSFNMKECNEKFLYDTKYGIIAPYFKEGIGQTFYKELYKNKYNIEEISEKVRLFYVAVTRAKEKMIIIVPKKDTEYYPNTSDYKKIKFRSFLDFMNMARYYIDKYYKTIDLDKINLTKDYIINNNNYLNLIFENDKKIEISDINIDNGNIIEKSFSKNIKSLLSKEDVKNIELGLQLHEILETINLKNPNLEFIENDFFKRKIQAFLNNPILEDIQNAEVYQEYEFIYESDFIYHGIIDLMLEYADHIDIIDYKSKNIDDISYVEQLNGYRDYIYSITNKKINLYLYSILDEKIKRI